MSLAKREGVRRLVGHMCAHGMESEDQWGVGLVLKPTGWLTNAEWVGREVAKKCGNLEKAFWADKHRHIQLLGGKAKACEIYPKSLCRAILRGFKRQLEEEGVLSRGGVGAICQINDDPSEWRGEGERNSSPHGCSGSAEWDEEMPELGECESEWDEGSEGF